MISHWEVSNLDVFVRQLVHVDETVVTQIVELGLAIVMLLEELKHLVQGVSIDAPHSLRREAHRYHSFRDVGEVQVEVFVVEPHAILRH